jgi:hypothetical protein
VNLALGAKIRCAAGARGDRASALVQSGRGDALDSRYRRGSRDPIPVNQFTLREVGRNGLP